jgi:ribose/xylose/arabinose/galactoside ABC-type transport system permease subunit
MSLVTTQAGGPGATGLPAERERRDLIEKARRYGIWFALALLLAYGFIRVPHFATGANLGDILAAVPVLGIVAVGQTYVIAAGGIDLSVGQLASLVSVLSIGMATSNAQLLWVVPMALLIGLISGAFSGAVIILARTNPVIVTFAMLSILQGLTYLYSQVSIGATPSYLSWLDRERVAGVVPVSAVLFGVVALAAWFAFTRMRFGVYLRAVGGNESSALRSGLPVARIKLLAYALSGLTAAVAGLLLGARLGTGYPGAGSGLELSAIVAVILGGTRFGGGQGTVLGTVAGVLLLATLSNALNLSEVDAQVQHIINGAVVAVAVSVYSVRRLR